MLSVCVSTSSKYFGSYPDSYLTVGKSQSSLVFIRVLIIFVMLGVFYILSLLVSGFGILNLIVQSRD